MHKRLNLCLFPRTNLLAPPERANSLRTALGVCVIKRLHICPQVHFPGGQWHLRHAAALPSFSCAMALLPAAGTPTCPYLEPFLLICLFCWLF